MSNRPMNVAHFSSLQDWMRRNSTRLRISALLVAHSRATRRAFILRVTIATACVAFALWVGRSLAESSDLRARWGAEIPVLVARTEIASGETVNESAVGEQMRPAALVPPNALRELPTAATASSLILEGDLLLSGRLADGEEGLAPPGTTAIRLDLAVTAPELASGSRIDILGPPDDGGSGPEGPPNAGAAVPVWKNSVEVISRDAVVLRPPTQDDATVEAAVSDRDLETVAAAALDGRVVVVRRSP